MALVATGSADPPQSVVDFEQSWGIQRPKRVGTALDQCGVDAAARALIRRPSAARLLGRWTPDGLAQDLAYHRTLEPDTPFRGIHLFPFGGVVRSARWLRDLRTIPGGDDDNAKKTNEMRAAGSPL